MTEISAEYIVEREGVEITRLQPAANDAEIAMNNTAEIKQTLCGTFYKNDTTNYITDRLRPTLTINGTCYPLGRYIMTDAEPDGSETGLTKVKITAYDMTYLVQCSTTEARQFFAAKTAYIEAIKTLLIDAGIEDYIIDYTADTLLTDREWDIYTDRLTIINDLLLEINYNSLWMDQNGYLRCTPYKQATAEHIDHTYRPGAESILYMPHSESVDYFNRANVFVVTAQTPDINEPMVATAVNDDPTSPFSTVNQRRRIVGREDMDNIASQEALQQYADNKKFSGMLATQETVFYTGPAPVHGAYDVIALEKEDASGIYAETEWSLQLYAPGKMTHRARRVISL